MRAPPHRPEPTRSTRRQFLGASASVPLLGTLACRGPSIAVPENVLVLVADDQSRVDLPCFGHGRCRMPNIDRLAAEGARFERYATPVPLCQPSRTALYTGLFPFQNGVFAFDPVRPEVPTWPELLGDSCATAMIGKLNVRPPTRFPFGHLRKLEDDAEGRDPETFGRLFAEFLRSIGGRRFCAVVNFIDPHRPFRGGQGGAAGYGLDEVWVPPFLIDTEETREDLVHYYGAMERVDRAVGLVLEELADRIDRTLVIYTSDNGMPFPFAKATLFEAGTNLPLVARWPGVLSPGSVREQACSVVDLLPTVLQAFGRPVPSGLAGRSLLPLFQASEVSGWPESQVTLLASNRKGDFPARALRAGRWKYIRSFQGDELFLSSEMQAGRSWKSWMGLAESDSAVRARMERLLRWPREQLFDLEADPWELDDLAPREGLRRELEALRADLGARLSRLGDPLVGVPERSGR